MQMVKLSSLKLDYNFYPRPEIDSVHVNEMVEAMKCKVEFPPILVCKKSKRIVDGFHRYETTRRLHGDTAEIAAVFKTYKNNADLLRDVVRHNSSHGKKLSHRDWAHCAILAEQVGLSLNLLAEDLHITIDKLSTIVTTKTAKTNGVSVAVKNTIRHKAGQQLTAKQVETNKSLTGLNQLTYVNQVISLIEADLLDTENAELMKRLKVLEKLLRKL